MSGDRETVEARLVRSLRQAVEITQGRRDSALLDALDRRGVVSIYLADGSQINPAITSLRAALEAALSPLSPTDGAV